MIIRDYFRRPTEELTLEMDDLLRYVAAKRVVEPERVQQACAFTVHETYDLTTEAMTRGYVRVEDLRRGAGIDRTLCVALTSLGYSCIGMRESRRLTSMQGEYVLRELHRLIPTSSVPEGLFGPDLIVPYDHDHHKPLLDAIWDCGILGSFAVWEKSFFEVVDDITTGDRLTVMVETTTCPATLEHRIKHVLRKSRADVTAFMVMPEMFDYAASFGYAMFHPWRDWKHDAVIVHAFNFLDALRNPRKKETNA